MDGVTEREGPGWGDKRPFYVALIDPFDLAGLCIRQGRNVRFWEEGDRAVEEAQSKTTVKASEV